ncbi:acid phosphatase [Exophiala viscosa]|uniref:acid phosphatase n=1 Tax=Exophiala viscosa TaxID=2486360 RepID=A0AAN6E3D2_9EURO|nr:acid phosphatase [Exophiala viscosa]
MLSSAVLLLAAGHLAAAVPAASSSYASRPAVSTVEPSLTAIQSAEATVKPVTPVSNVEGASFKRFYQVWLENIDYQSAMGDPNMAWLASQGITLSNYFATTHPSEPNYCAAAGGDNFGMDNDDFNVVPANVSTIVDLLDTKNISWAEYQEDLPYAGFLGFNYSNQKTYANDYVRKHNPLIFYESITNNSTRVRQIKGFTDFETDLKNQELPQWAFFTPNMTNDAHDTNITFGSKWERSFMAPLLNNSYFMNDTVVLLTFDENETYGIANKVFAILLGGAIPEKLKGTVDNTYYNHYSTIATVSENWGLPSLGRWDCNANVFDIVSSKTGKVNAALNFNDKSVYFNQSYPGPLSDELYSDVWPIPTNSSTCANGRGVLPSIVKTYAGQKASFNYTSPYPYDALTGLDVPSQ